MFATMEGGEEVPREEIELSRRPEGDIDGGEEKFLILKVDFKDFI